MQFLREIVLSDILRGGVFGFSYFPIPYHPPPLPVMGGVGHTINSCIIIGARTHGGCTSVNRGHGIRVHLNEQGTWDKGAPR